MFIFIINITCSFYLKMAHTDEYLTTDEGNFYIKLNTRDKADSYEIEDAVKGSSTEKIIRVTSKSNKVWDINGGKTELIIYSFHGNGNQRFEIDDLGGSVFMFKNGGKCMEYISSKQIFEKTNCNREEKNQRFLKLEIGASNLTVPYMSSDELTSYNSNMPNLYGLDSAYSKLSETTMLSKEYKNKLGLFDMKDIDNILNYRDSLYRGSYGGLYSHIPNINQDLMYNMNNNNNLQNSIGLYSSMYNSMDPYGIKNSYFGFDSASRYNPYIGGGFGNIFPNEVLREKYNGSINGLNKSIYNEMALTGNPYGHYYNHYGHERHLY